LLGFADAVEWSLATKMASNGKAVLDFLRDLGRRAKPTAEKEFAELSNYAAEHLDLSDLRPWDVAFASDRLRASRYAVDEQQVRAYFPVERVVAGWQQLLARLFGVRLVARSDVAVYHPDACYYDVVDEGGDVVAGIYLDLHARAGKRSGAWMAEARARRVDGDVRCLPVAYLVCNFAPPG
jgi:oligopeptidase A